jgi:hypothetical protein
MNSRIQPTHITYLTGISFDKQKWDQLYREALNDSDLTDFIEGAKKAQDRTTTLRTFGSLGRILDDYPEVIKYALSILADNIPIAGNKAWDLAQRCATNYLKYLNTSTIIDAATDIANHTATESTLNKENYLSLFMSNQGDARGLYALTAIAQNKTENSRVTWAYADMPFYDTRFIDAVYLKPTNKFTRATGITFRNSEGNQPQSLGDLIAYAFQTHAQDIVLGRILLAALKDTDHNQPTLTDACQLSELDENHIQIIQFLLETLKSRNLFGIDLLSRTLAFLHSIKQCDDNPGSKLIISTLDPQNNNPTTDILHEFTKELALLSGSQESIEWTDNAADADILLGATFGNEDDANYIPNAGQGNLNSHQWYRNHIFYHRAFEPDTYSIRIPVKMMISLPLDNNKKPNTDLSIPYSVSPQAFKQNDNTEFHSIILCAGGTEHNTPLVHLLNKHRWQNPGAPHPTTSFRHGFLDNILDFKRHNSERNNANRLRGAFLFGANQPVSGYQLDKTVNWRSEDNNGRSSNKNGKIIYFSLYDTTPHTHVVSLFGFSALSTAFLLQYMILKFEEHALNASSDFIQSFLGEFGAPNDSGKTIEINSETIFALEEEISNTLDGIDPFAYLANGGNTTRIKKILSRYFTIY